MHDLNEKDICERQMMVASKLIAGSLISLFISQYASAQTSLETVGTAQIAQFGERTPIAEKQALVFVNTEEFVDRLEHDTPSNEIVRDVADSIGRQMELLSQNGFEVVSIVQMQRIEDLPRYADAPELKPVLSQLVRKTNAAIDSAIAKHGRTENTRIIRLSGTDLSGWVKGENTPPNLARPLKELPQSNRVFRTNSSKKAGRGKRIHPYLGAELDLGQKWTISAKYARYGSGVPGFRHSGAFRAQMKF